LLFESKILPFFYLQNILSFEGAQHQSSSRLIKGFLSLFSFFKASIGLCGDYTRKFPLPFFKAIYLLRKRLKAQIR
jgi:hypothetical protein